MCMFSTALVVLLRKIVKNDCHFPSDETASKLLYLALRNVKKGLEDAAYHLATSSQSLRHSVRRAVHERHELRSFNGLSTQNSRHIRVRF
jgi:putative transposase